MDVPYDVAVSFLSQDEALAVKLHEDLSETLSVFVYSKRQEELAGTDGLESFRQTFLSQSRLIVVLYRDGWGKTRWTSVEELAIKERAFNGKWKSLLFVMLDEQSTPPDWLPETHIRLNHAQYGHAALIGAIKMRAEELGSVLRPATAVEKARRLESIELARITREQVLFERGTSALHEQCKRLRQDLDEKIDEIASTLTTVRLEHGADPQGYIIRTERVSLNFYLYPTSPVTESRIVVQEFDGSLILPQHRGQRAYLPGEGPRAVSKANFYFDYEAVRGWYWRQTDGGGKSFSSEDLSEHLIKRVLELHEQLRTRRNTPPHPRMRNYRATPWS